MKEEKVNHHHHRPTQLFRCGPEQLSAGKYALYFPGGGECEAIFSFCQQHRLIRYSQSLQGGVRSLTHGLAAQQAGTHVPRHTASSERCSAPQPPLCCLGPPWGEGWWLLAKGREAEGSTTEKQREEETRTTKFSRTHPSRQNILLPIL